MSRELFGKYFFDRGSSKSIFTVTIVNELGPPCWKKLEGGEGGATKC